MVLTDAGFKSALDGKVATQDQHYIIILYLQPLVNGKRELS